MFNLEITREQLTFATDLVNRHNFGTRGKADGAKRHQFTGILGQTVIADCLGLPRPNNQGFDGGYDLMFNSLTFDVKTTATNGSMKPYYVHSIVEWQLQFQVDAYLFCSLNRKDRVLEVCGWLPKYELETVSLYRPAGREFVRGDGTLGFSRYGSFDIRQERLRRLDAPADIVRIRREGVYAD